MNIEVLAIGLYVLTMLVVGYFVSLKIKTDEDYFLAGRSLGPWLATFSIFATWFGAESCIGTSGKVYRQGLYGAHADPFAYALCILLMGWIFARVLWTKKITTIPDLFKTRYSVKTEKLAALIMIPSSIVWASAQIRAFGQIINATTDVGVFAAVSFAAVVVIIYTMGGGLLADAYTDLIQGMALIVGLVIMIVAVIYSFGGVGETLSSLSAQREYLWNPEPMGLASRFEVLLVPLLGSLMSQELVSRVVASRSPQVAYHSSLKAGVVYIIVGSLPVLVGIFGHYFYPTISDSDTIMPVMAKQLLPFGLYVVFIGALVSAILSTVDSTLLAVSALFSHNLVLPLRKHTTEKQKVIIARLGVFTSGLVAYGIAFTSESVTGLVETASSLGGPTILVITSFALFSSRGSSFAAISAMVASIGVWFITHFLVESQTPVLWTVLACISTYLLVSGLEKPASVHKKIEI